MRFTVQEDGDNKIVPILYALESPAMDTVRIPQQHTTGDVMKRLIAIMVICLVMVFGVTSISIAQPDHRGDGPRGHRVERQRDDHRRFKKDDRRHDRKHDKKHVKKGKKHDKKRDGRHDRHRDERERFVKR